MIDTDITKEQIFIAAHPNNFPKKGFELACKLAKAHEKEICFLGILTNADHDKLLYENTFHEWCDKNQNKLEPKINYFVLDYDEDFTDFMEQAEAAILIFELGQQAPFNKPLKLLKLCRQLRIPYYFVQPDQEINFNKVLVPVGFLVEEKEKGVFCSGMGRFFHSEILLMTANDYGSRAQQNTDAIKSILDKFTIPYKTINAKKDSFKIEIEAAKIIKEVNADLLLITASRDYGMDDIIFGPKELKAIKISPVPVMVINPRKDLYTLCG